MVSTEAKVAMKADVCGAVGYPLGFMVIWILLSLLGLETPLLGPSLAVGSLFVSHVVDMRNRVQAVKQPTIEVLGIRAGFNGVLACAAFLITWLLNTFTSEPRGLLSFVMSATAVMGVLCVGRAMMLGSTALTRFKLNTVQLGNYFNWHQD